MKKFFVLMLLAIFATLPSLAWAAKDQKGASSKAREHANDNAVFKKNPNWFDDKGKKAENEVKKAQKDAEKAKKEAEKELKKKEKEAEKAKRKAEQEAKKKQQEAEKVVAELEKEASERK